MSLLSMANAAVAYQLGVSVPSEDELELEERQRPPRASLDAPREARRPRPRRPTPPSTRAPAAEQSAAAGHAEILLRLIPTEIIGAYIALLSVLAFKQPVDCQSSYSGRWWLFGLTVGLTPAVVALIYLGTAKRAGQKFKWSVIAFDMVAATIAFAAWASALPSTPFGNLCQWHPGYGTAAVIVTAVFLPLLAPVFSPSARRPPATDT
jgi:hypothetical protein